MEGKICNSCKKKVVNDRGSAGFLCPKCGESEIVRCTECRANAVKYHCGCGFIGPN